MRLRRRMMGFTLLEIMVVVSIIVVLVAIVIAVAGGGSKAEETITRQTLTVLKGMLEEYQRDGAPAPAQTDTASYSSKTFVDAVVTNPTGKQALGRMKAYQNGKVLDGWGHDIQYFSAGTATSGNQPYFRSVGQDGTPNTPDDIYSYDRL